MTSPQTAFAEVLAAYRQVYRQFLREPSVQDLGSALDRLDQALRPKSGPPDDVASLKLSLMSARDILQTALATAEYKDELGTDEVVNTDLVQPAFDRLDQACVKFGL